jgi:hypothetical protein
MAETRARDLVRRRGRRPATALWSLAVVLVAAATAALAPALFQRGPAPAAGGGGLAFAATSPDFAFVVKGDWGDGSDQQAAVTRSMCRWREQRPFRHVLTTGDNFYWPDGVATEANYFAPERCLNAGGALWRAAWGNHDYEGDSTATVLGAPARPGYYAWSEGDVAFFVYDGTDIDDAQRSWLRESVCGSRAKVKVIYGHQPPFSPGRYGGNQAVQDLVHPVARDCGAALVLSGHEHFYLRTEPIEGVTYVITGGGGAETYPCDGSARWVQLCESRRHFLYVEVSGRLVSVKAIDASGVVFDAVLLSGR